MVSPNLVLLIRKLPYFTGLRGVVPMGLAFLILFVGLALMCISHGTDKLQAFGFKILELSVQMVLVAVIGGVLVQAYVKWHARASSINEFRKATAEAVIREYSATKKARRMLRAICVQRPAGNDINPWTDVPVGAYDAQISSINDAQLALELVKRRLTLLGAAFKNPNGLSQKTKDMETYLGCIVSEYETHRNKTLKRALIPLAEVPRLEAFIARNVAGSNASDFATFSDPFGELLELLETEGIWVAV